MTHISSAQAKSDHNYSPATPPPMGKLRDRSFEAGTVGGGNRACNKAPKPRPAERKLVLVQGVYKAPDSPRRTAGSVSSAPDSGVHGGSQESVSAMSASSASSASPTSSTSPTSSALSASSASSAVSTASGSPAGSADAALDSPTASFPGGSLVPSSPTSTSSMRMDSPGAPRPFVLVRGTNPFDDSSSLYPDEEAAPSSSHGVAESTITDTPRAPATAPAKPPRAEPGAQPGAYAAHTDGFAPRAFRAPPAAVITRPEQHPDVGAALDALKHALDAAAAQAPTAASAPRTPRFTGAAVLRKIARAQQRSPDALHHRALDFYKAATALSIRQDKTAVRQAAVTLAALSQRATAEGYAAVDQHFFKRILTPLLHSLPLSTLGDLAHLNDRDDETGKQILRQAGKLLGAGQRRRTAKAEHAAREHAVASVLLGVLAETSREQLRAASGDRPASAALEAARNGQFQQLDAALREMCHGDQLIGDMERSRASRLVDMIGRLGWHQQEAMATMAGATDRRDATTDTFDEFMEIRIADFEPDKAVRDQMIRFVQDLRAACRTVSKRDAPVDTDTRRQPADAGAGIGAANPPALHQPALHQPAPAAAPGAYPPVITPGKTLGRSFREFRASIAARFRRTLTTQEAAKAQIKQAVLALIAGDRLGSDQLSALQPAARQDGIRPGAQAGRQPVRKPAPPASASLQRQLIRERLLKLDPGHLAQLDVNLAQARGQLRAAAQPDATLEAFYDMVQGQLEREAGIRRGAAALGQVVAALSRTDKPEKLLDALDVLADAQCQALAHQSEQDFYEDALDRLGEPTRAAACKRLRGRDDVQRHMRGIADVLSYAPPAWLQFRQTQLRLLWRAAHRQA